MLRLPHKCISEQGLKQCKGKLPQNAMQIFCTIDPLIPKEISPRYENGYKSHPEEFLQGHENCPLDLSNEQCVS